MADPTAIPLPAPAVATDYWAGVRFEDDEYRARFKRLRDQLVRRSLDAAVIADERTTWYFSGFGDSVQIGSKSRPRLLVLPVSGSPCAFVHSSTVTTVREMVWFDDVRGYDELRSAPVEEIAQLLRELGAQRIGVELAGGELQPELGYADVSRLQERLRPAELVDVSDAIWSLRTVKSEAEIARIRTACAITARAYETIFAELADGATERGVMRAACEALVAHGADSYWAVAVSGMGEYGRVDGVPRERRIRPGEMIFVDCGANVGGYWADYSRAAVHGGPSEEQRRLQAGIHEATIAGVAAVSPRATIADVARATSSVMDRHGFEFSSNSGRLGHGIGLLFTEPPDLTVVNETVLEPGMVLTIEPGVICDCGIFHCEENVLVTADGAELLSSSPSHLRTFAS